MWRRASRSAAIRRNRRWGATGTAVLAALGLGLCSVSLVAIGRLTPGHAAVAAAAATAAAVGAGAAVRALRAPEDENLSGNVGGAQALSGGAGAPRGVCRQAFAGHASRSPVSAAAAQQSAYATQSLARARRPLLGRDWLGLLLALATVLSFVLEKRAVAAGAAVGGNVVVPRGKYVEGLLWSCVAIVGKPAISAARKALAGWKDAIGHAEQVGVTSLIQGLAAAAFCAARLPAEGAAWPPPVFWLVTALSSALNAVIRTSETRAYAIGEMSLCAPFLAFDPVMQLLVGAALMPTTCRLLGWGCQEGVLFTMRHVFAVAAITQGMLSLSVRSSSDDEVAPQGLEAGPGPPRGRGVGAGVRLPRGASLIVLNCVIYAFTYRLDKAAVNLATTAFYFACSRLIMAVTCLAAGSGAVARPGHFAPRRFAPFRRGPVALVLLAVCAMDSFYMLSMFRAVALISPVLVSAVKRGGGVLVAAALGAGLFGEPLGGRRGPLLAVAVGVTLLCL